MSLSPELQEQVNAREQQMLDGIAAQLAEQNHLQPQQAEPIEDPFTFTEEDAREFSSKPEGLIPSVKAAIDKGFHVFALTPKDKHPLPGSQGFKDSKSPSDPQV